MLCHFLLPSIISDEKLLSFILSFFEKIKCSCFLTSLKFFFFVFNIQMSDYGVNWHNFSWLMQLWVCSSYLFGRYMSLAKFLKILVTVYLNNFSFFFFLLSIWGWNNIHVFFFFLVIQISKIPFIFQPIFCLLFKLNNFYCFIFKFMDSFL